MLAEANCAKCGKGLLIPKALALPSEACPDCMLADRTAVAPSFDFESEPSPLLSVTFDETATIRRRGGVVQDITVTAHVNFLRTCDYCGHKYPIQDTFHVCTTAGNIQDALDAGRRFVNRTVNTAAWRETKGVFCPRCRHFDPLAAQRHFLGGYLPFLRQALVGSESPLGLAVAFQCVGLIVLGFLVVPFVLCLAVAAAGKGLLGRDPADFMTWPVFAGLAALSGSLFVWKGIWPRWKNLASERRRRPAVERVLPFLDLGALYELVVRVYGEAPESLAGSCPASRAQAILEEWRAQHARDARPAEPVSWPPCQ
jgi:hypothetical protein